MSLFLPTLNKEDAKNVIHTTDGSPTSGLFVSQGRGGGGGKKWSKTWLAFLIKGVNGGKGAPEMREWVWIIQHCYWTTDASIGTNYRDDARPSRTQSLRAPLYAKFSNLGTWIAPMKLAFAKETMCRWLFACENPGNCATERAGTAVLNYQPLLRCWGRFLVPWKTRLQSDHADLSSVHVWAASPGFRDVALMCPYGLVDHPRCAPPCPSRSEAHRVPSMDPDPQVPLPLHPSPKAQRRERVEFVRGAANQWIPLSPGSAWFCSRSISPGRSWDSRGEVKSVTE